MLRIAVFLFLFQEYNCYLVLPTNKSFEVSPLSRRPVNYGEPPECYDWREHKMVSPVKNQLHCAACWAFSTIASIESHLRIYLQKDEVLSEQFLIDCDDANKGCSDASLLQTYANIVSKFGGVLRNSDYYPYSDGRKVCRWNSQQPKPVPIVGFRRVYPDEQVMAKFVFQYGPLSAAINSAAMAKYKGNYIDEPTDEECNPKQLNHAVLIVGYSVYESSCGSRKVPYWIIKNSWGSDWGDSGFYYLVRGRNACGIATDVSIPFVN